MQSQPEIERIVLHSRAWKTGGKKRGGGAGVQSKELR